MLRSELPRDAERGDDADDRVVELPRVDAAVALRLEDESVHAAGVRDVEGVEEIDEERERAAVGDHAPRRAEVGAAIVVEALRAQRPELGLEAVAVDRR